MSTAYLIARGVAIIIIQLPWAICAFCGWTQPWFGWFHRFRYPSDFVTAGVLSGVIYFALVVIAVGISRKRGERLKQLWRSLGLVTVVTKDMKTKEGAIEQRTVKVDYPRIQRHKTDIFIWNLPPHFKNEVIENNLEPIGRELKMKCISAQTTKERIGLFKRTGVRITIDRLPDIVWLHEWVSWRPYELFAGKTGDLSPEIIDTSNDSVILIGGTMGSGKSVALESLAAGFVLGCPDAEVIVASGIKPEVDYAQLRKNVPGLRLHKARSVEGMRGLIQDLEGVLLKIGRISAELSRWEGVKHFKDLPEKGDLTPTLIVLDELSSYLSKNSFADSESKELQKKLVSVAERIIREGRFSGTVTLLGSQQVNVEEALISLKLAQTIILGKVATAAESRSAITEDVAFDQSLTKGRMILAHGGAIKTIRAPKVDWKLTKIRRVFPPKVGA